VRDPEGPTLIGLAIVGGLGVQTMRRVAASMWPWLLPCLLAGILFSWISPNEFHVFEALVVGVL
jgi:hypothetical protein